MTLDSSGSLSIDTNTLHVDASNNRVGIGTTSPSQALHVAGGNPAGIIESTTSSGAFLQFKNTSSSGTNRLGYAVHDFVVDTNGTERMRIDANGRVTTPNQVAFMAQPTSLQSNLAVAGSGVDIDLGTERFDIGGNFASSTFTAPVEGKYALHALFYMNAVDSGTTYYEFTIKTSNRNYGLVVYVGAGGSTDHAYATWSSSVVADMDASDTAHLHYYQAGGTQQTDVSTGTYFMGYLLG